MFDTPLPIQPIPYQGSKRTLAPQICNFFPRNVETLYEPFAGSAAITIFAATYNLAERFVIGDSHAPLVLLLESIVERPHEVAEGYANVWHGQFDNPWHFNDCRTQFNESQDPVLLLYLIARCVKNAVRFNRSGKFSQSPDKRRTGMKPARLARTAITVSGLLKGRTSFFTGDFEQCTRSATGSDLLYLDPPYQGTTYGADKRYSAGLKRARLVSVLQDFDNRSLRYILSYDGQTGDKTYGPPLPETLDVNRFSLKAGRSAQSTINGNKADTVESLYVSKSLKVMQSGFTNIDVRQAYLFD